MSLFSRGDVVLYKLLFSSHLMSYIYAIIERVKPL